MHAANTERTPKRNPFKTQWRTNLPSFQECLSSLGTREDFRGFGEVLAAASPPVRERLECRDALNSPRMGGVDFSFVTLEVSDATSPGTPPHPVERYQQSCASTPEQTPRRFVVEDHGFGASTTPRKLPPLCPNVSPIAHSPSVAGGSSSAPRTEPQEVRLARSAETAEGVSSTVLKNGGNLEAAFCMECHVGAADYDAPPPPGIEVSPTYEDQLLASDDDGLGEWRAIGQRADGVIPPLSEWRDGSWLTTELTYRYGDFAYHHPLVYRVTSDTGNGNALKRFFFI
ncbi:hypothetical protein DQ04_00761110 [Trypanosoma grayi]|uniref:hypothetical protein n=1 Tax=Trypanosoma grayi TaxID=71804 RepID=UPI0004F46CE5|nr:hypothetical protein DQ04_00761110 [Trypanosoma grayi]KEG13831.1 hypothetical protein DQ04_00761110 [Trypanosoma grayi]